jgi:hypothetical protein
MRTSEEQPDWGPPVLPGLMFGTYPTNWENFIGVVDLSGMVDYLYGSDVHLLSTEVMDTGLEQPNP